MKLFSGVEFAALLPSCDKIAVVFKLIQELLRDRGSAEDLTSLVVLLCQKATEKNTLFNDHRGSLLKRQHRAVTIGRSPNGMENS